jgi:hypothetical protein
MLPDKFKRYFRAPFVSFTKACLTGNCRSDIVLSETRASVRAYHLPRRAQQGADVDSEERNERRDA